MNTNSISFDFTLPSYTAFDNSLRLSFILLESIHSCSLGVNILLKLITTFVKPLNLLGLFSLFSNVLTSILPFSPRFLPIVISSARKKFWKLVSDTPLTIFLRASASISVLATLTLSLSLSTLLRICLAASRALLANSNIPFTEKVRYVFLSNIVLPIVTLLNRLANSIICSTDIPDKLTLSVIYLLIDFVKNSL